jgi:hypothetical protein
MARTRSEISALVVLNTGRSDKTALINSQLDSALKIAVINHCFQDSMYTCDDIAIVEDATSSSLLSLTSSSVVLGELADVVTARIVEASGSRNTQLTIKNKHWWDKFVVNSEDNQKGWPQFGLRDGSSIMYDRPSDSGLELRLRVSIVPTFDTIMAFTSGGGTTVVTPVVGDLVTGATSGATAYIKSISVTSGTFVLTTAAGTFTLNKKVGTFTATEKLKIGADADVATVTADSSADSVTCPIPLLDVFLEQYATAMVFMSLGMTEKYLSWYFMAVGREYDKGRVGGTLLSAINKDGTTIAEDRLVGNSVSNRRCLSITNLTADDETYGETHSWY